VSKASIATLFGSKQELQTAIAARARQILDDRVFQPVREAPPGLARLETLGASVSGSGPGVVVMTEVPSITPDVARFARWVRNAGFTVWLPSLFGRDGAVPTLELAVATKGSGCVRGEFQAFAAVAAVAAAGRPGRHLRARIRDGRRQAATGCGGSHGVGLPVRRRSPLPGGTLRDVRAGARRPVRRPRDPGRGGGPAGWLGVPHSVVTTSLIEETGQPTAAARDELLAFLTERLHAEGPVPSVVPERHRPPRP
jgi:AcrR family transcriptional regulator